MDIPLKKPILGTDEIKKVSETIRSGVIAQGPVTSEFESLFSKKYKIKNSVAVSSGTAALHIILNAIDLKRGDEVITTPFSFIATASPILMCGAKPVFADVCPNSFNISIESVESLITKKTKAIIGVDLYGNLLNWKKLTTIAKKNDIFLIEDAAQAVGAKLGNKYAGSFGDAAYFSFYATKNLTSAEGGMICTRHKYISDFSRRFRQHGINVMGNYEYSHLGYNYRTTDLSSSIGVTQLNKISSWNRKRMNIAKLYNNAFKDIINIETPTSIDKESHVFHLYTLKVSPNLRNKLIKSLQQKGIGCGVYYPEPIFDIDFFKSFKPQDKNLVLNIRNLCQSVLSIPCEPYMTDKQVSKVIRSIKEFFKNA